MAPQTPPPNEPVLYRRNYPEDMASAAMHLATGQRTVRLRGTDVPVEAIAGQEAYKQSPLTTVHLARPPPLSRAQGIPYYEKKLAGSEMARLQLSSPYDLPNSVATPTVGQNTSMGYYPAQTITSNGYKPEMEYTKRSAGGKAKKDRPVRQTSPYNRFMSQEVKRIKAANPEVDHRKAFKMAASNWARSPTACQKSMIKEDSAGNDKAAHVESPMSVTESSNILSPQKEEPSGWISHAIDSQQGRAGKGSDAAEMQ